MEGTQRDGRLLSVKSALAQIDFLAMSHDELCMALAQLLSHEAMVRALVDSYEAESSSSSAGGAHAIPTTFVPARK